MCFSRVALAVAVSITGTAAHALDPGPGDRPSTARDPSTNFNKLGARSLQLPSTDSFVVGGTAISAILGSKAPVASPTFTGTATADRFAGDGSPLANLLRGTTKPIAISADTSIGHSVARFGTPGVDTCAGNDAVDDSVAINAAITYVASFGGGRVAFPNGADCRAANPIFLKAGVQLWGHGNTGVDGGFRPTKISPSQSMAALLTQSDTTKLINGIGLYNITLDGRRAGSPNAPSGKTITVGRLLDVMPIGSRFEGNTLAYSSGDGSYLRNDASSQAWINWFTGNQVYQNLGWGLRTESTDSIVANNYFGLNGIKGTAGGGKTATANGSGGCIWTQNYGNIRFFGNQIEICNVGVLEMSVDVGSFPSYGNFWTGNFFDLNNTSVQFAHGALSAGSEINHYGGFFNNRFNTVTDSHVTIDDYISAGTILNSTFNASDSGAATIRWLGTHAAKWAISGRFLAAPAARLQGPPADTALQVVGDSPQSRIPGLTASPAPDGTAVMGIDAGPGNVPTLEYRQSSAVKYRTRIDPATGALMTSNVEFGQDAFKVLFNGITQFVNPSIPAWSTVAALPSCDSSRKGMQVTVTDSKGTPTRAGSFTGGGTTTWPGFCDGSAWTAY